MAHGGYESIDTRIEGIRRDLVNKSLGLDAPLIVIGEQDFNN
jgi:hypothetical protein